MNTEQYTDERIVNGIVSNDERIIEYFFYQKCSPLFAYIIRNLFNSRVNKDELISELYLYLSDNDWRKVRKYDFRSKLTTWISVVAIRFFQKKRGELLENDSSETLYDKDVYETQDNLISKMDIEIILNRMSNKRYRDVIYSLFIEDMEPQELAKEMEITVDNLYNIKHRAIRQLAELNLLST